MVNTGKTQEIYGTRKALHVSKDGFYKDKQPFLDPNNKYRQLSSKMMTIHKAVGAMAIDRHKVNDFIDFYNNDEDDFMGAWFQFITDGDGQNVGVRDKSVENIGFLFTIFYKRTLRINNKSNISYIGKAFPAIRVEQRLKQSNKKFEKSRMFKSFLPFYQNQILQMWGERKKKIPAIDLSKELTDDNIKEIIVTLKGERGKINPMTIEIFIENPVTFYEISKYGFKYNINNNKDPKWEKYYKKFQEESEHWNAAELLKQSFLNSLNPPPEYLKTDITFSVNLTPQEWRNYFCAFYKQPAFRYYLWQNFNFPQSAFKVIIPVNAYNVGQLLKHGDYNLKDTQKDKIDELLAGK